jgi:hypothetical protein
MNKRCVVLIPVYKADLDSDELFSVKASLKHLQDFEVLFIGPEMLDITYYSKHFPKIQFKYFKKDFFASINGYNKLLTSEFFYESFNSYEYMLILQTDAIILKNELSKWIEKGYDYIGAPWPKGYSLLLKSKEIPLEDGVFCNTFVGNGGLSLRKINSCIDLINSFPDISSSWQKFGHAEDLYFSFVGTLKSEFKIPNFKTASEFSHDIDPIFLYKFNSNKIPFGCHAWKKYEPNHWIKIFDNLNLSYKG